jgi:hypothetical protein
MQKFEIVWDDAKLARLRNQVRAYRFPRVPENAG